jgi:hypothetical protein
VDTDNYRELLAGRVHRYAVGQNGLSSLIVPLKSNRPAFSPDTDGAVSQNGLLLKISDWGKKTPRLYRLTTHHILVAHVAWCRPLKMASSDFGGFAAVNGCAVETEGHRRELSIP